MLKYLFKYNIILSYKYMYIIKLISIIHLLIIVTIISHFFTYNSLLIIRLYIFIDSDFLILIIYLKEKVLWKDIRKKK